ncbi:MAG: phage protease [Roseibium sp.]
MDKHTPFLIAAADPVAADTSGTWIKLMPAGTFSARDGRGPFVSGDQSSMDAIIQRTKDYLGATDLMVDYDHQVLTTGEAGGSARAAGWIKDFSVRDDGIYGQVAWTDAATASIGSREYRYLSPLFLTDPKGRVIRLANMALVNTPALDLEAIAARAQFTFTKGSDMDPILEALGLAEGATEADALSAIKALQSGQCQIALAAGLDRQADAQTIATAIETAKETSAPDPAKFVPIEQVTALQADLRSLTDQVHGDKAELNVTDAIEAGKLAPSLKDWGLALATKDIGQFETFIAKAPSLTAAQLGDTPKSQGDGELTDSDLQVMSQMGLSRDDMIAAKTEDAA